MTCRGAHLRLLSLGFVALVAFSGCATNKTVPPLFEARPHIPSPPRLALVAPRTPPPVTTDTIVVRLPMEPAKPGDENAIMRAGALIKSGSSVVISVPASESERSPREEDGAPGSGFSFWTDGYFNSLEQYIERGLLSAGFHVKDRAKFEAKLRDLRDGAKVDRLSYEVALAALKKQLDSGQITEAQYAERAKMLREKTLSPAAAGSGRNREEMTDISEVIRAAQDGDVMADYVLQVNTCSFRQFSGTKLSLAGRPEVREFLGRNPGLRVGPADGHSIPAAWNRPWGETRFNAKLIDVKSGNIDWIGEYALQSLNVLDDGMEIRIGIRRRVVDGHVISGAIEDHNERLRTTYQRVTKTRAELANAYHEAMVSFKTEGGREQVDRIQNQRRSRIARAVKAYDDAVEAYREVERQRPAETRRDWTFIYDVDDPIVIPDLMNRTSQEADQRLREHARVLGSRVTQELLSTIKIASD